MAEKEEHNFAAWGGFRGEIHLVPRDAINLHACQKMGTLIPHSYGLGALVFTSQTACTAEPHSR